MKHIYTSTLFLILLLSACAPNAPSTQVAPTPSVSPEQQDEENNLTLTGPYLGQTPPVNEPQLFAPGIVSNDINHSSVALNPDGKELYWSSEAGGAERKIWFTKLEQGEWTKPEVVSFCKEDAYGYDNPFITPDGKKLFFTTNRPGAVSQEKETIWYAERTSSGWSDPQPISSEVNETPLHWSISVSDSGTLYFQFQDMRGESPGGIGDIYYSEFVNGEYTKPVSIGSAINTPATETCPHIAPDESYIVFTRFDETNVENTGIFISYKDQAGKWLPPVLAEGGTKEKGGLSPRISPDGKYLFYVNGGMWWMPAGFIEALRPTHTPELSTATTTPTETATPLPTKMSTPVPTYTGSGGGVIAYCYQPLTGDSLHQIYAINADGSDNRKLIAASIGLNHHDWASEGNRIAAVGYADSSTWSIYVFDVGGSNLTRLTNTPGVWDSEPSWSPDDEQIAFTRIYPDQGEREEIWVMNADGSGQRWIGLEGFAAKWSPDGSRFVYTSNRTGNYEIYTANIDGTDEQQITNTSANEFFPAWSPDGKQIAFSASTGAWNTPENTQTYELYVMNADATNMRQLTDNSAYDGNPRWSPDGSLIVFSSDLSGPGHWEIYTMNADGSDVRQITHTPSNATAINPVWRPATTISEPASVSIQAVISADTADHLKLLRTLDGHNNRIISLAFSGDGAYIASSSLDKTIKWWEVSNGQERQTFNINKVNMNGIAFSPDGTLFGTADAIWEVESSQMVHTLVQNRQDMGVVAFSPDGATLAIALENKPIQLWNVTSGEVERTFDKIAANITFSIAFSPDGEMLAEGVHGGLVRLWDVASGQVIGTLEHGNDYDDIHDVAFSPDGSLLASGGTTKTVRLWDVASGRVIHTLSFEGVMGLAFSPDGTILATAGGYGGVRLWDVTSGKMLLSLPHNDELMAVVFSPDGTLLASGGYDWKIYLWGLP